MFPEYFSAMVDEQGDDHLVRLHGELDLASADELRQLLEQASSTVVVDLSDLSFIDSSGLVALLMAQRTLRARGDDLVVRGQSLSGPVRRVFEMSGVNDLIQEE